MAFTLNYVGPNAFDLQGFGRGFISRHLLTSTSLKHALSIIEDTPAATGASVCYAHVRTRLRAYHALCVSSLILFLHLHLLCVCVHGRCNVCCFLQPLQGEG